MALVATDRLVIDGTTTLNPRSQSELDAAPDQMEESAQSYLSEPNLEWSPDLECGLDRRLHKYLSWPW